MPTNYRRKKDNDPQPILTNRRGNIPENLANEDLIAVGRVMAAAVSHGNAVYIAPGRFGTVSMKVYIDGEQYAENLNPGDDWEALTEAIIEALYDQKTVARWRLGFVARNVEPAREASPVAIEGLRPGRRSSVETDGSGKA